MNQSVSYSTFCCPKDQDRVLALAQEHADSHRYPFDAKFFVFQRCAESLVCPDGFNPIRIQENDYALLLNGFGIQYPDPVLSELTHGWGAPHFFAHHLVNHLSVLKQATTDYIAFADGDCFIKDTPADGPSWIDMGIEILENNPDVFVVCPNEGGPGRRETIMSQQMFLIDRKKFLGMEFIPWDGTFINGGPFQEYYGLLEGWIGRFMAKRGLFRYVLPPEWRYWHLAYH